MSFNIKEVEEDINQLSKRQRLELHSDLVSNLCVLKSMVNLSRSYKSDMLDSGEAKSTSNMVLELENQMYQLSQKLKLVDELYLK